MRILGLLAVIVTGILLIIAVADFPDWADPNSPASTHVSPHYITESMRETSVPNVVTAVLADYRSFDTMFETAVIFTAGVAVIIILRQYWKRNDDEKNELDTDISYEDTIIRFISRQMVPFVQLFALYVVAHGHHSPGGGFQGGVIFGASFILLGLSFSLKMVLKRMSEKWNVILGNIGVFIFAGIGALCVMYGAQFLNYSVLKVILPFTDSIEARSHGILGVEIGVAVAVSAIMITIYANIASHGKLDKGL